MRKLAVLALLLACAPVFAFNLGFLEYTPTYYFNQTDLEMMQDTIVKALNHGQDNHRYSWRNPNSTAFGYVMPLDTNRQNGQLCRHAKIYNSAKSVTGAATYNFCKINGEWKVG